jgi:D-aminoacyl-tRNA deacylase
MLLAVNLMCKLCLVVETFFSKKPVPQNDIPMILLVSSNKDPASLNIADQILQHFPFQKTLEDFQSSPIYTGNINQRSVTFIRLNEVLVDAQSLPESFPNAELIVFVSRHSSQSGTPTLTVHPPGNFADADLGGLPRTVSVSPAVAMSAALRQLVFFQQKFGLLDYDVSFEVTHHGPSLNVPTMFVELGSSMSQWTDSKAAYVVACATISAIENFESKPAQKAVIGIGGTHYNKKFTQMALNGEVVFGHMIPKYAVTNVDASMLKHCVERSLEQISEVLLDWRGIKSEDKPDLLAALDESGVVYRKI